jgi:hypothetical protein
MEETLVIHKYKLSAQQVENFHWLKAQGIDTEIKTLCYWSKKYPLEKLEACLNEAKAYKAESIGAYMQKLLKTNANVKTMESIKNREFAEEYYGINNTEGVQFTQKYIKIPYGKDFIEIPYNIAATEFASRIINFEKHFMR